ncbi:MAG: CRISPR-associated endonuclease Cas2 [Candidatus Yanofskybacteria bacterium]|nr:CRISPR-associated endonuclease Cas2 [Candidatus Yanofskybacteria bacterium]
MRIKNNSLTFNILRVIKDFLNETKEAVSDLGPSFGALMSRKSLGEVLSAMPGYKSSQASYKWNYYASFNRLKKNGFIKFSNKDQFVLTEKGKGILVKFDIDAIKLRDFDPNKWDNTWRVLIFDIPELTRVVRNLFRDKIQELGFYTLQKSVYVTPVVCEKEIMELAYLLKIRNGVDIIHALKLGRKELAAKKFFGIQ